MLNFYPSWLTQWHVAEMYTLYSMSILISVSLTYVIKSRPFDNDRLELALGVLGFNTVATVDSVVSQR